MGSFKGLKQDRKIVEDCIQNKMHPIYHIKIDIELETGEYFMSDKVKSEKKWQERQKKQNERTAESKRKRMDAFVPPKEPNAEAPSTSTNGKNDVDALAGSLKIKAKDFGKKKALENIDPQEYIAAAPEVPSKKQKRSKSQKQ